MSEDAQALKTVSGWGMLWGILTILFGFMAMGAPLQSGLAATLVVGAALLAAGVSMIIFSFQTPSLGKIVIKLLFGALTVAVGISVLSEPGIALVKLTVLVGILFVVDGFLGFIVSWNVKPEKGWDWLLFNALITLVLGVMILKGWPENSLVVIGILAGIRLVFAGITMLTIGTAARQDAKAFE